MVIFNIPLFDGFSDVVVSCQFWVKKNLSRSRCSQIRIPTVDGSACLMISHLVPIFIESQFLMLNMWLNHVKSQKTLMFFSTIPPKKRLGDPQRWKGLRLLRLQQFPATPARIHHLRSCLGCCSRWRPCCSQGSAFFVQAMLSSGDPKVEGFQAI